MSQNRIMERVSQIAYAVDDVAGAAARFASRLGAGPFFFRHHPPMRCTDGQGAPGVFHHSSAYGQWGDVQVELVTVHGAPVRPGIHHVARFVPDLDAAIGRLGALGWPLAMWAETGSGIRFAFCDSRADLGHLVELYEPTPGLLRFYADIRAASEGWDGCSPVRAMEDLATSR